MELIMFSKPWGQIVDLSLRQTGQRIASLGFDGVDLTVRPGGHVPPESVEHELPRAIDQLGDLGLSVPMITTAITDPDAPTARSIFETAGSLGIPYLKLGYWSYSGIGSLSSDLDTLKRNLSGIRALSEETGVTPAIHTHSGPYLGANPAILQELLQAGPRKTLGLYADPGHLVLEGAGTGWQQVLEFLGDSLTMISLKDGRWVQRPDGNWDSEWVPFGEGMVDWDTVFELLSEVDFDGPVSVHSEYAGQDLDGLHRQTAVDLEVLCKHGPFSIPD